MREARRLRAPGIAGFTSRDSDRSPREERAGQQVAAFSAKCRRCVPLCSCASSGRC